MTKIWNKVISIGDWLFEVNTQKEKLVGLEFKDCQWPFENLDFTNRAYASGYFDLEHKIFLRSAVDDPNVIQFKILKSILLDVRLNQINLNRANEIAERNGYNSYLVREDIVKRLYERRPVVDIGGNPYVFDLENMLLVHRNMPGNMIRLSDCKKNEQTGEYECYFDLRINRRVEIDPSLPQPAEILIVTLPSLEQLDPIGMAQKKGISIIKYLKEHPIIRDLAAKTEPVNKDTIVKRRETTIEQERRIYSKSIKK